MVNRIGPAFILTIGANLGFFLLWEEHFRETFHNALSHKVENKFVLCNSNLNF